MTSETPCPPNCFGAYVPSRDNHLPGCPNAPKPAEPRKRVMIVGSGISAALAAVMTAKPAEPPQIRHGVNCDCKNKLVCELIEEAENKRKPAEPPACGCDTFDVMGRSYGHDIGCSNHAKPEPQSEPPIDWGLMIDRIDREFGGTYSKPIAALKAELDALKAEVENVRQYARIEITDLRAVRGGLEMRLQTELAKNAALKVRVDDLENLVLDIDDGQEAATVYARAIRARRQEASNGE